MTAQEWTDSSPHEIRYVTVAPGVRLEAGLGWRRDPVAGLIYIDAGHDPTDIGRLRGPELGSLSPALLEAMERTFENPELVRRTQWHTGEVGVRLPFASSDAGRRICNRVSSLLA